MSQIDELQGRITAALDRISRALEASDGVPDTDSEELDALRDQLEDEKVVSAQLEERNKRLKEKLDDLEAAAEAGLEEQRTSIKKLDSELQALRRANQQLRENNKALREANEAGVAEPHLINKAMLAELEGLRAARNSDRAETEAVLSELTRLLDGAEREDA